MEGSTFAEPLGAPAGRLAGLDGEHIGEPEPEKGPAESRRRQRTAPA
jgi:hypothetical protein